MQNINGYDFEGPYPMSSNFNDVPGIYLIHTSQIWLDVGETDKLKTRMANHERSGCWQNHANGAMINLMFHREANIDTRLAIESEMRDFLSPTCGDR